MGSFSPLLSPCRTRAKRWPAGGSPMGRATPMGRASTSRPPSPARSPHCVVSGPGKGPPSFSSPCRTGRGPRGCLRSHHPSPRLSLSTGCHRSRGTSGSEWGMFHVSQCPESCRLPQPSQGETFARLDRSMDPRPAQKDGLQEKGILKKQRNARLESPVACPSASLLQNRARFGRVC